MTEFTVASSDDVTLALHHLAPGPTGSPLLVAHATGFNAPAYRPFAVALADRFDVWALDFRGHGESPNPHGVVDWQRYGDDAVAAVGWLADRAGAGPVAGFGHSMGGAALLMAALRRPELVRGLALFEPIVFAPRDEPAPPNGLAEGALRRRRRFDSFQAAFDNFASKPPMNAFDPDALRGYVWGGLAPVDPTDAEGPVELRCSPEHEAATFRAAESGLWADLPAITTPTLVIGGTTATGEGPALFAPDVADQLPAGRYEQHADLDHFGPFAQPATTADIVANALATT